MKNTLNPSPIYLVAVHSYLGGCRHLDNLYAFKVFHSLSSAEHAVGHIDDFKGCIYQEVGQKFSVSSFPSGSSVSVFPDDLIFSEIISLPYISKFCSLPYFVMDAINMFNSGVSIKDFAPNPVLCKEIPYVEA